MKFGIVSDSSCDLQAEYTEKEQVSVVSFYVSFDGEHYLKEGKEAVITEFYQNFYAVDSGLYGCLPAFCGKGNASAVHLSYENLQRFYAVSGQCKGRD